MVQSPEIKACRRIAASHNHSPNWIYPGKIPAPVHAVVVVEAQLDMCGNVTDVAFSRTPGHAAEAAPMIATLIAPPRRFRTPPGRGYTQIAVWLWDGDGNGNFQLATLARDPRSR